MSEPPIPTGQLQIKVPEDLEAGVFATAAMVGNSQDAFFIDFVVMLPGVDPPTARVVSRVYFPPAQAAEILKALSQQLDNHETTYGPIRPYPGGGLAGPPLDA